MNLRRILFSSDHFFIVAICCAITLLLSLATFNLPFLDPIARGLRNLSVTDMYFALENKVSKKDTCKSIVIVDMTELGSRSDIGNLLIQIGRSHPKVIGIDLIFEGVKDDIEGNLILEEAVEEISPVSVFANKLTGYSSEKRKFSGVVMSYFRDMMLLDEGYTNITDNMEGNTVRELTTTQNTTFGICHSFAERILYKAGYRDCAIGKSTINYHPTNFIVIPFDKVEENSDQLKDKIVLVGALNEEADNHLTPLGKTSGVEIQAYSVLTLLEHHNVITLGMVCNIVIALLMCYIYELLFEAISVFIRSRDTRLQIFLSDSNILFTVASFVYIPVISLLSFFLFIKCNVCVDMVIVLVMVPFVGLSRRLYIGAKNALQYRKGLTIK